MTPVDMITTHDPPNSWGDCYRACVASLLDMQPQDVPHFFEDGCTAIEAYDRLTAFLRPRELYPMGFIVTEKYRDEWFDCTRGMYILGGTSPRGTSHFVIATGRGTLIHDPHPTDKSGVTPDVDGSLAVVFFVKLFESVRPEDSKVDPWT